jgi:hypothetical protein
MEKKNNTGVLLVLTEAHIVDKGLCRLYRA